MSGFEFCIEHWSAWSPGLESREDWRAWAKSGVVELDETKPDLSQFPAMLRRRLSSTGKIAVHSLIKLGSGLDVTDLNAAGLSSTEKIPAVFCSQYGEVARSIKLLASIVAESPLSPTDFSLSVHNAVAGVYSIGCSQTSTMTAMSAGADGLIPALIESVGLAASEPRKRCICVLYDAPLPEPYPSAMNQCQKPYALALMVSLDDETHQSSDSIKLCAEAVKNHHTTEAGQSAFQFIRFLLDPEQNEIALYSGSRRWKLSRMAKG